MPTHFESLSENDNMIITIGIAPGLNSRNELRAADVAGLQTANT
jgi:hypothetical protein